MKDEEVNFIQENSVTVTHDEHFKELIMAYPWMSYRSDFKEINGFTSDSGWGCMIRVGQMLLAHTFIQLQLRSLKEDSVSLLT